MTIDDFLASLTGGDLPADAVREGRCLMPPTGCGEPLTARVFRDAAEARLYAVEWRISGLCPGCQDRVVAGEGDE